MDHATLMAKMGASLFCPIVAGDTQSSRRLTEVVLAGCIPVFVGPPFHTLPLAADVDYPAFSVGGRARRQGRGYRQAFGARATSFAGSLGHCPPLPTQLRLFRLLRSCCSPSPCCCRYLST